MKYEDERVDDGEQLAFVLHLGDFTYEVVDYPEDRPERHRYDRRLRDAIRFPDGERLSKTSHIAASLADYRALYRAFIDMGGHGYATVRFAADAMECEFVCIPRPLERSASNDGGPIRYRVVHRCRRWGKGERPALGQQVVEGDPGLGL